MQIIYVLIFLQSSSTPFLFAQDLNSSEDSESISLLFKEQSTLPIKLSYSNKELRKHTNDSTYIKTTLSYKSDIDELRELDVQIRARGKFRRENCYFPPVKIKIKKSEAKGTLFSDHKKLKLVVPCKLEKDNNDNVVKEYIAYKLYEVISPYHFKTRLVDISLSETRGKKMKEHQIKGFLIEDDKKVAKRHSGKVIKASIHPLGQDDLTSVRNAFFQFMICNIDFSTAKQHNAKLLYIDKQIFPVPYDFDMSGLVNASYSVVSQTQNNEITITSVEERQYRGFKRNDEIITKVRQEFLNNKGRMLDILDDTEVLFENKNEFIKAKSLISEFFRVLINEKRFTKDVIEQMRN
jgi:hypothetical protein